MLARSWISQQLRAHIACSLLHRPLSERRAQRNIKPVVQRGTGGENQPL